MSQLQPRSDPADARPADDVAADQDGDAARLGLVGRRRSTPSPPRCARKLIDVVDGARHARVRADAGQRHVLGRGGGQHAGAARRPRAGAGQRRLRQAHGEAHADDGPPHVRRSRPPTTCRPPRADVDRLLAADPSITHVGLIHCETSTGILNPLRGDRRRRRAPRQAPDRRCDELVRRAADRRARRCRSTR